MVTEVRPGDVFETRLEASEETPDIATNLVINGKEYFGSEGGGACRSDGSMFGGWLKPGESSVDNPTARILCTIPTNIEKGSTIELIGFQFRNCEGDTQEDGTVRCNVTKSSNRITLIMDDADNKDEDKDDEKETSTSIENRILKDIMKVLFGNNADDAGDTGEDPSPEPEPGDDEPEETPEPGNETPITGAAVTLANCVADKHAEYIMNYKKHLPYILTYAQKRGTSIEQTAYIIATGKHETGDYQWMSELADGTQYNGRVEGLSNVVPNDGPRFKGRGYVQLTGRGNYTKYTHIPLRKQDPKYAEYKSVLDPVLESYANKDYSGALTKRENLLANPTYIIDDFNGAAAILVNGMMDGNFTGAALPQYVSGGKKDYINARRVVNGTDKAPKFAASAVRFEGYLRECNAK